MNEDDPPDRLSWSPSKVKFRSLLQRFATESPTVYIVGGAVRDAMRSHLGQSVSTKSHALADIDLVVPDKACDIARRVADLEGWAFYKLDAERDIARLVYTEAEPPLVCDVSRFQGETLEADLAVRDFALNAMAFQLEPSSDLVTFFDFHNGLSDLRQKQIRQIRSQNLLSDPNRLLRAVRQSVQLDFEIEEETERVIRNNAHLIVESSQERIRDELWKGLATERCAEFIEALRHLGLLQWVLPEVEKLIGVPQTTPHHLDVYQHTLLTVRHAGFLRDWLLRDNRKASLSIPSASCPNSSPTELMMETLHKWLDPLTAHFRRELAVGHPHADWLVWFALFHDVGKPETRTEEKEADGTVRQRFFEHEHVGAQLASERLSTLHFSRDEIKLAAKVISGHMRPHHLHASFPQIPISRRACYRFYRDMGTVQENTLIGPDVALLALADTRAIHKGLDVLCVMSTGDQAQDDEEVLTYWSAYLEHVDQLLAFGFDDGGIPAISQPRLIDGHQLMEHFGLAPGPEMGQILEQIAEAQATGEVNTLEDALTWVAKQLPSTLQ